MTLYLLGQACCKSSHGDDAKIQLVKIIEVHYARVNFSIIRLQLEIFLYLKAERERLPPLSGKLWG